MVAGGKADCGRIRKEKSESGTLWGAGNTVRRKMNGVGGKRTADGSAEERAKMGGHWAQGDGKEVDGWRQWGARTADGSAEKRAKMRGVATQWVPEGSEWRIQTHGASRADSGRPDADAIRRTHILFLLMELDIICVSSTNHVIGMFSSALINSLIFKHSRILENCNNDMRILT